MKKILSIGLPVFMGTAVGVCFIVNKTNKIIAKKQTEKEKFRILYQMLECWMRIVQRGDKLQDYFEAHGYHNIAVYGMGDVGKLLLHELKGSTVKVKYGIDRNPFLNRDVRVVTPNEVAEEVDAVVVTVIDCFDEIAKVIAENLSCPIISLEDIVYEMG